jgi:hypothetical protein
MPLTAQTARLVVASASFNGELTGVTAFESADSVAIAKALATRKGRLSLPNLVKISPKTLTALIEKRDVVIPLIEKLQLIPEPDGTAHEDFMMPQWLAERQLSADTDKIESLTVEQARRLVETFRGVPMRLATEEPGSCPEARVLIEPKGLPLNGLKKLDAGVARVLARYRGLLALDGLQTLDADSVWELAEFRGGLSLDGLTDLGVDTAKAIATFRCGTLCLDGLARLDADTARVLAGFKGGALSLGGLSRLDTETIQALAEFDGGLRLSGLTTLDADSAKVLVAATGWDGRLPKLTTLDAETARALATKATNELCLSGLTMLDADAAQAIAGAEAWTGHLPNLTNLDAGTAKALAEAVKWDGHLPKLATLESPDSAAIAKALAMRQGRLSLPNLRKISPKTLAALIEKKNVEIPLIETLELIPEPDGSANEDFVIPEWLEKKQQQGR